MSTFTTQCNYCAFRLTEDQSTEAKARFVETKYATLRGAVNAPRKSRVITVGIGGPRVDKTETCFIDSSTWVKREENIHCPDRIDHTLSLETALDLREARKANLLAEEAIKRADSSNSIADRASKAAEESNSLAERSNKLAEVANSTALDSRIWAIIATIIATIAIAMPYIMEYLKSSS
jgi:hypothetical protein